MEMIAVAVALVVGLVIGQVLASKKAASRLEAAQSRLEKLKAQRETELDQLREELVAEQRGAEDELKASQAELREERDELQATEKQLKADRQAMDKERQKIANETRELLKKEKRVSSHLARMEDQERELNQALERVANLTQEEAVTRLEQQLLGEAEERAAGEVRRIQQRIKDDIKQETARVLAQAVYRYGSETVAEITTTPVPLPGDESKGRIIGREGRNIQAFERATGVDVIIDDTPEMVTLSCFNPIRREVARIALVKLIEDGRIHPSRIEEQVEKAKKNLDRSLRVRGEELAADLGIHGLNPALLTALGRLHLHQILGQNQLALASNVAQLSERIAEVLGQNVKTARRAGLLAVIGRGADHLQEGSAAQVSANLAGKHGESKAVLAALNDLASDEDPKTISGMIVRSALSLAESRPGARSEQLAKAIERLAQLESLAGDDEGVRSVHAVQAGREVRVLVDPERVAEGHLLALAQRLARRIEEQADIVGEVRVHVVRETRIAETAM